MSPKTSEEPEDVTALGPKARRSVEKSVAEEVKEQTEGLGRRSPGMPAKAEFTTPRVQQGEDES